MRILAMKSVESNGFTLVELLVVLLIIGLVYSLALNTLYGQKYIKKSKDLRSYLEPFKEKEHDEVSYVVYDDCTKSGVEINGVLLEKTIKKNNAGKYEAYDLDRYGRLTKIFFSPMKYKDRVYDVCFRYTLYSNGASSGYIVKNGGIYIVYFPYFEKPKRTDSEKRAIALFARKELLPLEGSYYE